MPTYASFWLPTLRYAFSTRHLLKARTMTLLTRPCFGQTEDQIKDWMRREVRLGTVVVVRNTQAGFLHYAKAIVIRLGRGRFEVNTLGSGCLSPAGLTFYYSGKNCRHPKGQTRLVIPTEKVLQACGSPGDLGLGYSATTV